MYACGEVNTAQEAHVILSEGLLRQRIQVVVDTFLSRGGESLRSGASGGATSHEDLFASLFSDLLRLAEETVCICLSSASLLGLSSSFSFLGACFWAELMEALRRNNLRTIFSSHHPDSFSKMYLRWQHFVGELQRLCQNCDPTSSEDLTQHPSYHAFEDAWNFSIYYSLRFQELVEPLENCLSDSHQGTGRAPDALRATLVVRSEDAVGAAPMCFTEGCLRAQLLVQRAWSSEVLLTPVIPKMLRLTMQVVSRLVQHGRQLCSQDSVGPSSLLTWQLDLHALCQFISWTLLMYRSSCWHDCGSDTVKAVMQDLVSDMRLDVDTLLSQEVHPRLAALLTGMCLQPLAQIPKVMSAYRMTSRDVTGPSDYIQEVLHPLQSLLEEVPMSPSQSTQVKEEGWWHQVVLGIVERFYVQCREVIDTGRKTEESLRKLMQMQQQGGQQGSGSVDAEGSAGGQKRPVSDMDRITAQLCLDVHTLQSLLRKMGLWPPPPSPPASDGCPPDARGVVGERMEELEHLVHAGRTILEAAGLWTN